MNFYLEKILSETLNVKRISLKFLKLIFEKPPLLFINQIILNKLLFITYIIFCNIEINKYLFIGIRFVKKLLQYLKLSKLTGFIS